MTDAASLMAAFEIVEEIVGLGAYHDNPEATARLLELPRGLTPPPGGDLTVYRSLALTEREWAQLHADGLVVASQAVASWTRCPDAARMIARGRLARRGVHRVITVARTTPSDSVLVDVPALYRRLQFDVACVESWDLYARFEKEVILHAVPSFTVRPGDVRAELDPAEIESYRPIPGERLWIGREEIMDTIDAVVGPCSKRGDTLTWRVETRDDRSGIAWYDARHHSWTLGPMTHH